MKPVPPVINSHRPSSSSRSLAAPLRKVSRSRLGLEDEEITPRSCSGQIRREAGTVPCPLDWRIPCVRRVTGG